MASRSVIWDAIKQLKNYPGSLPWVTERVIDERVIDATTVMRRACVVQNVALAGAAQQTLTASLPAGCRVLYAGVYLETAVVLTTATNLAIGTAAVPSAFYLSGAVMTVNTNDFQPTADANARVAVATPIKLTTTNGGGALTGTGVGTVKCVVVYEYVTSIVA